MLAKPLEKEQASQPSPRRMMDVDKTEAAKLIRPCIQQFIEELNSLEQQDYFDSLRLMMHQILLGFDESSSQALEKKDSKVPWTDDQIRLSLSTFLQQVSARCTAQFEQENTRAKDGGSTWVALTTSQLSQRNTATSTEHLGTVLLQEFKQKIIGLQSSSISDAVNFFHFSIGNLEVGKPIMEIQILINKKSPPDGWEVVKQPLSSSRITSVGKSITLCFRRKMPADGDRPPITGMLLLGATETIPYGFDIVMTPEGLIGNLMEEEKDTGQYLCVTRGRTTAGCGVPFCDIRVLNKTLRAHEIPQGLFPFRQTVVQQSVEINASFTLAFQVDVSSSLIPFSEYLFAVQMKNKQLPPQAKDSTQEWYGKALGTLAASMSCCQPQLLSAAINCFIRLPNEWMSGELVNLFVRYVCGVVPLLLPTINDALVMLQFVLFMRDIYQRLLNALSTESVVLLVETCLLLRQYDPQQQALKSIITDTVGLILWRTWVPEGKEREGSQPNTSNPSRSDAEKLKLTLKSAIAGLYAQPRHAAGTMEFRSVLLTVVEELQKLGSMPTEAAADVEADVALSAASSPETSVQNQKLEEEKRSLLVLVRKNIEQQYEKRHRGPQSFTAIAMPANDAIEIEVDTAQDTVKFTQRGDESVFRLSSLTKVDARTPGLLAIDFGPPTPFRRVIQFDNEHDKETLHGLLAPKMPKPHLSTSTSTTASISTSTSTSTSSVASSAASTSTTTSTGTSTTITSTSTTSSGQRLSMSSAPSSSASSTTSSISTTSTVISSLRPMARSSMSSTSPSPLLVSNSPRNSSDSLHSRIRSESEMKMSVAQKYAQPPRPKLSIKTPLNQSLSSPMTPFGGAFSTTSFLNSKAPNAGQAPGQNQANSHQWSFPSGTEIPPFPPIDHLPRLSQQTDLRSLEKNLAAITLLLCHAVEWVPHNIKPTHVPFKSNLRAYAMGLLHHIVSQIADFPLAFSTSQGFLKILRKFVCPTLLNATSSTLDLIFEMALQSFDLLWQHLRTSLGLELTVFMRHLCGLLSSPLCTTARKLSIIRLFGRSILLKPDALLEIFCNCDMCPGGKAPDTLATMVRTLARASVSQTVTETVDGADDSPEARLRFEAMNLLVYIVDLLKDKVVEGNSDGFAPDKTLNAVWTTNFEYRQKLVEATKRAQFMIQKQKKLKAVVQIFQERLSSMTPGVMARVIGEFLIRHAAFVNSVELAEFLSDEDWAGPVKSPDTTRERAMTTAGDKLDLPYSIILAAFLAHFDFVCMPFDAALRTFLCDGRLQPPSLSSDTIRLARLLEPFSIKYCEQNPGVFPSAQSALLLALACVTYNTDFLDTKNKSKKPLSFAVFSQNLKLGESELPVQVAQDVYDNLSSRPLVWDPTSPLPMESLGGSAPADVEDAVTMNSLVECVFDEEDHNHAGVRYFLMQLKRRQALGREQWNVADELLKKVAVVDVCQAIFSSFCSSFIMRTFHAVGEKTVDMSMIQLCLRGVEKSIDLAEGFKLDASQQVFNKLWQSLRERRRLVELRDAIYATSPSLVKVHRHLLRSYNNTIQASELVGWLLSSGNSGSRQDAINLGQDLFQVGLTPVTACTEFLDGNNLYHFAPITFGLSNEDKAPPPTLNKRLLTVKVVKAKGLRNKNFFGKSSPYCIVELLSNLDEPLEDRTTAPVKSELNPVFEDMEFAFVLKDEVSSFRVIIWDYEGQGDVNKGFMGMASVAVKDMEPFISKQEWRVLGSHTYTDLDDAIEQEQKQLERGGSKMLERKADVRGAVLLEYKLTLPDSRFGELPPSMSPFDTALMLSLRPSIVSACWDPREFKESDKEQYKQNIMQQWRTPRTGEFTFTDHRPLVFRQIRRSFEFSDGGFITSLCAEPILPFGMSKGKSGSLFYQTSDRRFFLKTIKTQELKFLMSILPSYYNFIADNRHTFIPRFFGCFTIQRGGSSNAFILMNNVFDTTLTIHATFDLKGSTAGRQVSKEDRQNFVENQQSSAIMKDLDFEEMDNVECVVIPDVRKKLAEQLKKDCDFLESHSIMDYSLLLGIHYVAKDDLPFDDEPDPSPEISKVNGEPPSPKSAPKLKRRKSGQKCQDARCNKPVYGRWPYCLTHRNNYFSKRKQTGAEAAWDGEGSILGLSEDLYWIGIIDILQTYNAKKKLETTFKSLPYGSQAISSVNPKKYASRFLDFILNRVIPEEPKAKRAGLQSGSSHSNLDGVVSTQNASGARVRSTTPSRTTKSRSTSKPRGPP